MYAAPYGKNIPECVSEIQPGKKYKIHKTLSTRNDDKDFDMTRFEEIKEWQFAPPEPAENPPDKTVKEQESNVPMD